MSNVRGIASNVTTAVNSLRESTAKILRRHEQELVRGFQLRLHRVEGDLKKAQKKSERAAQDAALNQKAVASELDFLRTHSSNLEKDVQKLQRRLNDRQRRLDAKLDERQFLVNEVVDVKQWLRRHMEFLHFCIAHEEEAVRSAQQHGVWPLDHEDDFTGLDVDNELSRLEKLAFENAQKLYVPKEQRLKKSESFASHIVVTPSCSVLELDKGTTHVSATHPLQATALADEYRKIRSKELDTFAPPTPAALASALALQRMDSSSISSLTSARPLTQRGPKKSASAPVLTKRPKTSPAAITSTSKIAESFHPTGNLALRNEQQRLQREVRELQKQLREARQVVENLQHREEPEDEVKLAISRLLNDMNALLQTPGDANAMETRERLKGLAELLHVRLYSSPLPSARSTSKSTPSHSRSQSHTLPRKLACDGESFARIELVAQPKTIHPSSPRRSVVCVSPTKDAKKMDASPTPEGVSQHTGRDAASDSVNLGAYKAFNVDLSSSSSDSLDELC
ncbi:MAG: hypothetical protein MHM6MM_003079 [Cercozoa sp. M6MM]